MKIVGTEPMQILLCCIMNGLNNKRSVEIFGFGKCVSHIPLTDSNVPSHSYSGQPSAASLINLL